MSADLGLPGALILVFLLGWIVGRAGHAMQRMEAGTAWTAAAEASARADHERDCRLTWEVRAANAAGLFLAEQKAHERTKTDLTRVEELAAGLTDEHLT